MKNSLVKLSRLKKGDGHIAAKAASMFYKDKVTSQRMNKFLENKSNYLIIAEIDDAIAGFVLGYRLDSWHKKSSEMFIYDIEVLKSFRRYGIGTKLIDYIKSIAKKEKFDGFWLLTNRSNKPAVKFYKRLGGKEQNKDDIMFSFKLTQ